MDYTETWPRCPEAARFFDDKFHAFAAANPLIGSMTARFLNGAGVDLRNLIDHWAFPDDERGTLAAQLKAAGLQESSTVDGEPVWIVPGARLPRVRLSRTLAHPRLAIAVDDVAHFLKTNSLTPNIVAGDPDSAFEAARIAMSQGELSVVARRGYDGFRPGELTDRQREAIARSRSDFAGRPRVGEESAVIASARALFETHAASIGQARAVDEFFAAERVYYTARNKAAQWIYRQQVALGFGWANHDHHTYRSTRDGFYDLMNLFERAMGFTAREKFYAGADAGWGAQVLEHPISRVVMFCDLDMDPQELAIDYAAERLAPRPELGTIGLWCALHTSSIAESGMHHIECEYNFEAASTLFAAKGHRVMKPFTDLPMLKQRFTEPQMWRVSEERLNQVEELGAITSDQAQSFRANGAAGSHVEILQRWDGFKGFNKTGVSNIIRETDARRAAGSKA